MSEESDALLHIADDHPCCKTTLIWAHKHFAQLERENAELKIERNRYKVALEDIALANDQWPGYKAREVLGKEAQP